MDRERFLSIWNGVALLIFFAGIFLGIQIGGYSTLFIAIFMWIIGSTVATIIYGDPKKKPVKQLQGAPIQASAGPMTTGHRVDLKSKFCSSCGDENTSDADFCMNCGNSFSKPTFETSNK